MVSDLLISCIANESCIATELQSKWHKAVVACLRGYSDRHFIYCMLHYVAAGWILMNYMLRLCTPDSILI